LGADHYLQPTYGFNNQLYLCLGISDGGPNSLIILGDTFMKGKSNKAKLLTIYLAFYIIFDRENRRIGFIGPPGSIEVVEDPVQNFPYWAFAGIIVGSIFAMFITIVAVIMTVCWYNSKTPTGYELLVNKT
jgi:hypothetical protein